MQCDDAVAAFGRDQFLYIVARLSVGDAVPSVSVAGFNRPLMCECPDDSEMQRDNTVAALQRGQVLRVVAALGVGGAFPGVRLAFPLPELVCYRLPKVDLNVVECVAAVRRLDELLVVTVFVVGDAMESEAVAACPFDVYLGGGARNAGLAPHRANGMEIVLSFFSDGTFLIDIAAKVDGPCLLRIALGAGPVIVAHW